MNINLSTKHAIRNRTKEVFVRVVVHQTNGTIKPLKTLFGVLSKNEVAGKLAKLKTKINAHP